MAQMKKLNGYEIVDQGARDTKQNKVLYGESDPSNSTGEDGDVYISTTSADVINDLQSQINNKASKNDPLLSFTLTNSNYDFHNIPHQICYGEWYGSNGVGNAPDGTDGHYFKIGNIIIAVSGWDSNNKWIKMNWEGWKNWVKF